MHELPSVASVGHPAALPAREGQPSIKRCPLITRTAACRTAHTCPQVVGIAG